MVRHLKNYTFFWTAGEPPKAYGVFGAHDELVNILGLRRGLAMLRRSCCLQGKIVIDGLIRNPLPLVLGGNLRKSLSIGYSGGQGQVRCHHLPCRYREEQLERGGCRDAQVLPQDPVQLRYVHG